MGPKLGNFKVVIERSSFQFLPTVKLRPITWYNKNHIYVTNFTDFENFLHFFNFFHFSKL